MKTRGSEAIAPSERARPSKIDPQPSGSGSALSRYAAVPAKEWRLLSVRMAALLLVLLMSSGGLVAYSVLTHEEIVDLVWTTEIRLLLLS